MATRYYLPVSGAPAVSPAIDVSWGSQDYVLSPQYVKLVTTKTTTGPTDGSIILSSVGGDVANTYLLRQYVSDPIGVQNFNGTTVSAVLRCVVSNTSGGQAKFRFVVRLYHTDTTFTTLLSAADYDSVFSATAQTRIANAVALANVTSQNNDRIVIDIGIDVTTLAGNRTFTERFQDANASDFALTSGLTTDLNPWFEFSATIPAASTRNSNFLSIGKW